MDKYNFLALAKERYSCRKYKPEAVPGELMDCLLEAALAAPTGCNLQPWRIMVINSKEGLDKVKACTPYSFGAPCVLAVLACGSEGWTRKYDGKSCRVIDAAIVATHIVLAAASLGLGTCWVMSFDPARFSEDFITDKDLEPVALIPLGFPAEDAVPSGAHRTVRDLKELVSCR